MGLLRSAFTLLWTIAICSALTAPAKAAPAPIGRLTTALPNPITLADAIRIALANQPQQSIATAQVEQQAGILQQARSQYFPTVTPSYQYENARQTTYGTGFTTITTPTGGTYRIPNDQVISSHGGTATVALNENVFDTGNREIANAQARRALASAAYGAVNTRQQIVSNVTQQFYALLGAIDIVKVAQADLERFNQTLQFTQAQVAAGSLAKIQTLQAQANYNNAQVTLLQDQASVATSAAALKNAMGIETDAPIQPAPIAPPDQLPALPSPGKPLTLQEDYDLAIANRPDVKQQQESVASAELQVKQARINAGFTVAGTYALIYNPANDLGAKGSDSRFIVTASYPLFDSGNARGALHAAEAQRDAAVAQLESVRQGVRLDVERAYVQREADYRSAQLAQTAVDAATQNYNAAVASRKAGVATLLDVITAQSTLTSSQNQYVAAVYNYYIADASLQKAIGRNL